jgi:geranylgeranyl diphosphate synthase type 3
MRDETKSLDYTRKVVLDLKEQAINEIARLGGQPQLEKILDLLVA